MLCHLPVHTDRLMCLQRAARTGLLASIAAALVACGGGAESDADRLHPLAVKEGSIAQSPASEPAALADLVVDVESGKVVTTGSFHRRNGYLSKAARVLRSDGGGSAIFRIATPQAGRYELFTWWPQALPDAGWIEISVTDAAGTPGLLMRDQRGGGGEWQSIGVYEFAAGSTAVIRVRSADGAALYVDAVRMRQLAPDQTGLPTFATNALPIGLAGEAYSGAMAMSGGRPPFSFSLSQGTLPPGLALDSATGAITGKPLSRGESAFTLTARDALGQSASRSFTLLIDTSAGSASAAQGMQPGTSAMGPRQPLSAATSSVPDVSSLLSIVANMAEGEWRRVNLNAYSAVWTPASLRPLYFGSNPDPSRIILAWSSFAWDPNRAALLLYGGGHANYRGNDVYLWRASTQLWERAALPSEMVQDGLGNWNAIDGVDKAPASAHTYDNTVFLPILDRMLVLGGAADSSGGHYLTQATATTSRYTGVYLFDPARAHPDKVGGSTGSHVKRVAPYPEVVGGNMWSNRESWLNASATSTPPKEVLSNGCTGYAVENGRDVVYVRSAHRIYRYEIKDLANPAADTWQQVGMYYYGNSGGQGTCAYDPDRKLLLSTHNQKAPFIYWTFNKLVPNNLDTLVSPTDPTGEFQALLASNSALMSHQCAIEFDPVRRNFKLWCADGRIWTVTPPPVLGAQGWSIVKEPTPVGTVPNESIGTGILGKWKYIPNLDVFMGLADAVQGNIWLYKPRGWVNPSGGGSPENILPNVALTTPADQAQFEQGADIAIAAGATDSDGVVAKVAFYADGAIVGESAGPTFGIVWSGAAAGTHVLTAVATDDDGATRTSAPVTITVNAAPSNQPPTVRVSRPADGATFTHGSDIVIEASAADPDGSIASVEFFVGSNRIGAASGTPFTIVWSQPPLGTSTITARATDDRGATATSAPLTVSVVPSSGGGTATLQRGVSPATSAWETYLSSYHKSTNFGISNRMPDQFAAYSILLRFAIFQSEGGPVPNGAQITSAVLSVYKYSLYNMNYSVHRLQQDWSETGATWNQRLPGVAWTVGGAGGIGTDFAETADATASIDFNPGWVAFDVTGSLQQMSTAPEPRNYGWRLRGISGYLSGLKYFHTSEAADPALRPKLVITWQQ